MKNFKAPASSCASYAPFSKFSGIILLILFFMLINSAVFADSYGNKNASGLQVGSAFSSDSNAGREIENARGLFDRIMGKHSSSFVLEILNVKTGNPVQKEESPAAQDMPLS